MHTIAEKCRPPEVVWGSGVKSARKQALNIFRQVGLISSAARLHSVQAASGLDK